MHCRECPFSRKKRVVILVTCVACLTLILVKTTNIYPRAKPSTYGQEPTASFTNDQYIQDNNTGVPKILHQIWSNDVIPNEFVQNVQGLVKLNPPPEWSYWFWTLARGRELIQLKYPKLIPLFDGVDDLMKSDILRTCIIHQYGGVYFDLDTVGVKPLKPFVESTKCSLVVGPPEHSIGKDTIVRVDYITNSALFCQARHPFYTGMVKLLEKQKPTCKLPVRCVGPYVYSHLYHELRRVNTYTLLPRLETHQLFQDVYDKGSTRTATTQCSGTNYLNAEIWRREMCDEWIRRGKENRKLSELAYTYHTWYHVGARKVTSDPQNRIHNVVPHAVLFDSPEFRKH